MLRRLLGLPPLAIVATILLVALTSQGAMNAGLLSGAAELPDFAAACRTDNPYLVTSCFRGILRSQHSESFSLRAPSVIMFNETQNDLPHYQLADFRQVGSIWGLAYSQREKAVYASAYQKRQVPFGPSGPGAIYRIDLTTGEVTTFAQVPDPGPDVHQPKANITAGKDERTHDLVGRSGLGDLDLDEDDRYLASVNLNNRRIYVYDTTTGQLAHDFEIGAAGETWADDARPFGLEIHHDYLYQAVVHSAQSTRSRSDLALYVYRSQIDGSDLREMARVPLNYPRGEIRVGSSGLRASVGWKPWNDNYARLRSSSFQYNIYPMPMATDLEIEEDGALTIALRDRLTDLTLQQAVYGVNQDTDESLGIGVGDLLRGTWDDASEKYLVQPAPEYWQDDLRFIGDESALGGLAYINLAFVAGELRQMAATALGTQNKLQLETPREGVLYYAPDGSKIGDAYDTGYKREEVCAAEVSLRPFALAAPDLLQPAVARAHNGEIPPPPPPFPPPTRDDPVPTGQPPRATNTPPPSAPVVVRGPGTIGDLELLCKAVAEIPTVIPVTPTPTDPPPAPTNTPLPPTDTPPPPTSTPTPVPPTPVPPTPTPRPEAIYLPVLLKEDCKDVDVHADVVLVLDMSTSMLRPSGSGASTKLDDVLRATKAFVGLMRLAPDGAGNHDQIAVIGFNETAWQEQALSGDAAAVQAALDRLPAKMVEGTRLDLAFQAGREAFAADKVQQGNTPVMVLLTDGLPNKVPTQPGERQEDVVIREAQQAKDLGIRVYTIGVGRSDPDAPLADQVSAWLLSACATDPSMSFIEPNAEQLSGVYSRIAFTIACQQKLFGQSTRP